MNPRIFFVLYRFLELGKRRKHFKEQRIYCGAKRSRNYKFKTRFREFTIKNKKPKSRISKIKKNT